MGFLGYCATDFTCRDVIDILGRNLTPSVFVARAALTL
jgi:hypothetical protein